MDADITQEEGEILDLDDEEIEIIQNEEEVEYEVIKRPEIQRPSTEFQQLQHSDTDSDDSDEDNPRKIKKPLPRKQKYSSKSGNLWAEMLHEEDLTSNLKVCEVNRKRKHEVDRGVETYELNNAVELKKPRTEQTTSKEPPLVRKFAKGGKLKSLHRPKTLPELTLTEGCSDEDFSKEVSSKLDESNVDLIQKVIAVIGREQVEKLYKKTQNMEQKGGMLILNKTRRRTSGGIFLFLVKTANDISEAQKKEIFDSKKQEEEMVAT